MAEPGVPVPPIPPALGAPGPSGVAPTTYREYYDNDAHDTARGDYGAIMATFVMPVVGAPPPQQVSDTFYASAVVDPQAFVLLVTNNDHPNGKPRCPKTSGPVLELESLEFVTLFFT